VFLPGVGAAQPVTATTSNAPMQYQPPAARTTIIRQNPNQQAKVFSGYMAAPADISTCPTPTLAQCSTTTYLFTGCGRAHQATCKSIMTPSYQNYFDNLAPKGLEPAKRTRDMFVFGTQARASDLKKGKFHGTLPTSPVKVDSKSFRDQTRLKNAPANANPKTYVPHPDWDGNGAAVNSCEEYAYEKYYDWHRFQDAVSLCKGDYACAYEVAYVPNAPPGIARRQLKRKDGQAMLGQPNPLSPAAKNAFFGAAKTFVLAEPTLDPGSGRMRLAGLLSFTDLKAQFPGAAGDLEQLRQTVNGVTATASSNAWPYHEITRTRTANVTENEFEEFERRRAELEFYVGSIAAISTGGAHFGLEANEFVHPLDEVAQIYTYDPWERTTIFLDEQLRTQRQMMAFTPALQRNRAALFGGGGAARIGGSAVPRSGTGSMATLAFKPYVRANLQQVAPTVVTFMAPQLTCTQIPPMDVAACEENSNNCRGMSGPDAMREQNARNWNEYAKCKILNITLTEWWRRKAQLPQGCNDRGSCGCLDPNSYACDWSPKMFYDAYIAKAPETGSIIDGKWADVTYVRDADYDYCKRWSYAGFNNIPAADKASGNALEGYLDRKREELEKILKRIPQKVNSPGVLGQDFSDSAQEGDTDSWSAGYSMNAGWEMKVGQYNPDACQLQGNANAAFTAKITTPIDGVVGNMSNLWNRAVDADVWARVNQNNDQKVRYESHLLIADQELFAAPKPYKRWKRFTPFDPNDAGSHHTFSLNKAFEKPLFNDTKKTPKLTLTVWAGPVPITGSVWAELSYGVDAIAKGAITAGCSPNMTSFESMAGFQPYFNLSGAMSLGVGVGGIVSAGVRGYLTLIGAKLPIGARVWLSGTGATRRLNFGVDASLDLNSLSGRMSLYVEFLLFEEEWELFNWRGVHTKLPLLRAVNESFDFLALNAIKPG
jgi:hypothetical protein